MLKPGSARDMNVFMKKQRTWFSEAGRSFIDGSG